jgi:cyclase
MLRPRLIPILLILENSLVKTRQFRDFRYVGDPCNTAKIFNEVEVDELIVLDIGCSRRNTSMNFELIKNLADECFMPLTYGGGIKSIADAAKLFEIGVEKISINTAAIESPSLITELANEFGSQAVVVSIDSMGGPDNSNVVRNLNQVTTVAWSKEVESRGAGEILLTSVDLEGTWSGLDIQTIGEVANSVNIPLIAHGGANSLQNVRDVIRATAASSVGIGSLAVYQKKNCGVLVHYPQAKELEELFND